VYEILHSVKHIRERVFTQATETRIYHQYILKARDPNLRGRWKENRKPGEYEEPGVDCFVRQQCGVCAAEYPTKVVNAAAAAEMGPGEVSIRVLKVVYFSSWVQKVVYFYKPM
jgi:hypothetical protein